MSNQTGSVTIANHNYLKYMESQCRQIMRIQRENHQVEIRKEAKQKELQKRRNRLDLDPQNQNQNNENILDQVFDLFEELYLDYQQIHCNLQSQDLNIQTNTLQWLRTKTQSEQFRNKHVKELQRSGILKLVEQNVIDEYMNQQHLTILQQSMWILTNVIAKSDEVVINDKLIDVVVNLLKNDHITIINEAIHMVGNLAVDNQDYKQQMVKLGVVDNMFQAYQQHYKLVQPGQELYSWIWSISIMIRINPYIDFQTSLQVSNEFVQILQYYGTNLQQDTYYDIFQVILVLLTKIRQAQYDESDQEQLKQDQDPSILEYYNFLNKYDEFMDWITQQWFINIIRHILVNQNMSYQTRKLMFKLFKTICKFQDYGQTLIESIDLVDLVKYYIDTFRQDYDIIKCLLDILQDWSISNTKVFDQLMADNEIIISLVRLLDEEWMDRMSLSVISVMTVMTWQPNQQIFCKLMQSGLLCVLDRIMANIEILSQDGVYNDIQTLLKQMTTCSHVISQRIYGSEVLSLDDNDF